MNRNLYTTQVKEGKDLCVTKQKSNANSRIE